MTKPHHHHDAHVQHMHTALRHIVAAGKTRDETTTQTVAEHYAKMTPLDSDPVPKGTP